MCKHAVTWHANKRYKLVIIVFIQTRHFQSRTLWYAFQTLYAQK